jgi:hypothetical protein
MRHITLLAAPAAVLALAGQLLAGGFWLQLGNPEASTEARNSNAVLTIKAVGCHEPAKAQVTATAIGKLNGQRQVIPLKLTPLSEPGMYALAKQWPGEGRWVIRLTGRNGDQFTNTLVTAGPKGVDRLQAKNDSRHFVERDVDAMLK